MEKHNKLETKHIVIIFGALLVLFILGTFFDLDINRTIFSSRNPVGVFISAFGPYAACGGLAFLGNALIANMQKQESFPKWAKYLLYALGAGMVCAGVYFQQKEISSVNGFQFDGTFKIVLFKVNILGTLIATPLIAVAAFFGYKAGKKCPYKNLWMIILLVDIVYIVPLLGIITVVKGIMHRPRYRALATGLGEELFHAWYSPFPEYESYITSVITAEEFKSFPSGHAGYGSMAMVILPLLPYFYDKLKGKETMLFYIGFAWYVIVAGARMLLGAHYLSDVTMGSMLLLVFFIPANIYINRHENFFSEKF